MSALKMASSLCRPHVSMALRINSSDGLVLYTGGGAVMSLSVSDGHLLVLLDGGKRKVSLRSRRKYNDDRWHTVSSHATQSCDHAAQETWFSCH